MGPRKETLRVFVVGCSRSGTTFLQSLLATHPRLISFPESSLFFSLCRDRDRRIFFPPRPGGNSAREIARRSLLKHGVVSPVLLRGLQCFLRQIGRQDLADEFYRLTPFARTFCQVVFAAFDRLAGDAEATGWIEKTPMHLHYITEIERFAPPSNFIHIVRNPEDNIASIWDAKQKYGGHWEKLYPTVEDCVDRWNACIRDTLKCEGKRNHFIISYEHLVDYTEDVMQNFFDSLGVDWNPIWLSERSAGLNSIVRPSEEWKNRTSDDIERIEKFESVFSELEKQRIRNRLKESGSLELWSHLRLDSGTEIGIR